MDQDRVALQCNKLLISQFFQDLINQTTRKKLYSLLWNQKKKDIFTSEAAAMQTDVAILNLPLSDALSCVLHARAKRLQDTKWLPNYFVFRNPSARARKMQDSV